ncbi:MAG: efflux RND transporter periplasmic adaptor subunit, partial [Pseudomonadota bacterium]
MRDLIDDAEGTLVGQRPPARRRSRRAPVLWILLATVAAVAVLGGARYAVPVETRAHQATAGPFHVALKGPGTLEARRHTVLSTTVQGRLEALPFDVGDHVEAGTPVARLEDNEARIDLGQATEEARATVHQIAEAEAQLRREEATLMRYERDLARQAELRARGVIADGAHDIARAERDAAVARVAEARARIERLRAELAVATHQVERREEAVTQTLVTAPFDAVVVAKAREIGDVVTPGTAILEIVDPATLILSARLDESEMARVEQGQAALVRFESEPARAHRATVHRIGREVDRETREFSVELTLASLP